MMLKYNDAKGDDARLYWCLKVGSMSHKRIYATMSQLYSRLTMSQVAELIELHIDQGNLEVIPHPVSKAQNYYKLSERVQKTITNDT